MPVLVQRFGEQKNVLFCRWPLNTIIKQTLLRFSRDFDTSDKVKILKWCTTACSSFFLALFHGHCR